MKSDTSETLGAAKSCVKKTTKQPVRRRVGIERFFDAQGNFCGNPALRREGMTQLYRHFDGDGKLLYIGTSLSALIRLDGHSREAEWFGQIASVTIEKFETRRAALYAEAVAIAQENPPFNRDRPDPSRFVDVPPCKTCMGEPHICIGVSHRRCERRMRARRNSPERAGFQ